MPFDHQLLLVEVLRSQPELRFGFVARASGEVLAEAGDRSSLPYQGAVDISKRPESIAAFYEQCEEYANTDPRMLPRGYAQGSVHGVICIPSPGVLLVVFGERPASLAKAPSTEKVAWFSSYRRRTWSAVEAAYRTGR
jgi:hypothetical protein